MLRAFAAIFLVGVLTFVRTVIYEIRDMQNDQIVGKETLPIFMGKATTKAVLLVLLGTLLAGTLWLTFENRQQGHPLAVALVLLLYLVTLSQRLPDLGDASSEYSEMADRYRRVPLA